jgi:hypothetical protein
VMGRERTLRRIDAAIERVDSLAAVG